MLDLIWTIIIGAIVATYLGQFIGLYAEGQHARFIGSIVGAVIILLVFRLIRRSV